MCNPAAALMAGQMFLSHQDTKKHARQEEENIAAAERNSELQSQVEQHQISAQATDELSLRAKQALQERARVRVATGEAGIAGATAERAVNDVDTQKGWDVARILSNAQAKVTQSQMEQRGRRAQFQSRRNQITRPNALAAGLQIAGAYYAGKEK